MFEVRADLAEHLRKIAVIAEMRRRQIMSFIDDKEIPRELC